MRVYIEGETLLIDVTESLHEESLNVYVVDHGKQQRIEGELRISPKRSIKLKMDRRVQGLPAAV